jgi:Transposase DDE domain
MRTLLPSIPGHLIKLIELLRTRLCDPQFVARHRVRPEDFTRHRQLTFPIVMLFILQKTIKSIQRHLHEFLDELAAGQSFKPVTASAWTHRRAKLKHSAFIELNEQVVLPLAQEQPLRRWHGHRLFGHDSSLLRLPDSPPLAEVFGRMEVTNQKGATGTAYPQARLSVVYDLLNGLGVDTRLEPSRIGEVSVAIEQAARVPAGDVVINDCGFTGFVYLAEHVRRGVEVISRCSKGSFLVAQTMFRTNRAPLSVKTKICAPADRRAELKARGLPVELTVRFISLRLPDGKLEVLVTTLLDAQQYPTEEFLEVYHYRWNHETFHHVLKSRLDLENFSGQTAEAVRQDVHAAVLLSNLETLLTQPAQEAVKQSSLPEQQPKQINRADAYHALKAQLLPLLYSETPAEKVIEKLQSWFMAKPLSVAPQRKVPRRKLSFHRSYHFQRRVKKAVF